MKTIIYQQADDFLKQPVVTLQFPDALPGDEMQNMEDEKIREEIHTILQHAVIEHVMSTNIFSENTAAKQDKAEGNT